MGGTRSARGRDEKCVEYFSRKIWKNVTIRKKGVDVKIILERILRK